ncbi:hypothetical protein [Pseudofrankia inefficax]|uniref:Uncharacterized protein n=1 Tax=Pseudofrankia inefficax (strain DSM 45817 / CECT 9037 / DDB 130130 / EuI1c) TaxID=298654 RepID=E3J741_PSEI1|nr:hypothetical protein [Pseudofrankia inefficax]ADP84405.1 hypothetical protein FraEuI1c_6424 [Pseudofrankia inefficax]
MDVTLVGKPTEVQLALDALNLIMSVEQSSVPEPAGDGLFRVHAVVIDPDDPRYQISDDVLAAELGLTLPPAQAARRDETRDGTP